MPATPFSYPRAEPAAPLVTTERMPLAANGGHRISLHHCVAVLLIFDLLAIFGLGLLSTIWADSPLALIVEQAPPIGVSLVLFVFLARSTDVYNPHRILDLQDSVRRLLTALFLTFAVLLVLGAATKTTQSYSRVWFFSWAALTCAILPASRLAALAHIRHRLNTKGAFVFRALSVGIVSDPLSAEEIALRTQNRVKPVCVMRFQDLGALAEIASKIARENIDQIYITIPWESTPNALHHLELLRKFSAQVFILPDNQRLCSRPLGASTFGNRLSLTTVERPIDGWDLWLKRMQDVIVATITIIVFAPVMFGVALAIKLEGPGPILFRQKRTGFNGSIFELWKFRSMYVEQTDPNALRQTDRRDSRVTRVGHFIRHMSIDEMPQFFNVLQGSMSVVGPRPHALETRADGQLLDELVDSYAARHRVKPGLTGWAQINGLRGELDSTEKLEQRVKYDIDYIEKWSMWLDLKIILRTVILIFYDPAAY
jgi:polysaccharide biosynthesis protein PslA